jgi:hypothetical protein
MTVIKVFEGKTIALLEKAVNDWLLANEEVYESQNMEIRLTGSSDTNKWVALVEVKKISRTTVLNNQNGTGAGFLFT